MCGPNEKGKGGEVDSKYFKELSLNYHRSKKHIFELLHEDLKSGKYTYRHLSKLYGIDESTVGRHAKIVGAKSPHPDRELSLYEHVYRRLSKQLHKHDGFTPRQRFYSIEDLCEEEDIPRYTAVKVISQLRLDGYIYKADNNRNYVT